MLKVSAIVPVFNPGGNIDECIESLVGQSLPRDEYEVIFVDDGSTDGTGARLDALAAEHPNVRVEHIANSGWPGKPRNVGLEMARGEFVLFVDNDDYVGTEALERLYDRASMDDADVVLGKVVGRDKFVPWRLFAEDRSDVTLDWPPLLSLLTPHRLFRRALLDQNGIRFPEGRRRLEDHFFTMHAYFHARHISILADYPCYYWVQRAGGRTTSYRGFDPVPYYENLREVLDLVVEHTEPGPLRDRLLAHWYRGKMLGRAGGTWFRNRTPEVRRAFYDEIVKLTHERYGPEVDQWLPASLRVRSFLLRERTFESLATLAAWEAELRADVTVGEARRDPGGAFAMPFRARIVDMEGKPLLFTRAADRTTRWMPPAPLRAELPDEALDMTEALANAEAQVLIRARDDDAEFVVPTEYEYVLEPAEDGAVTPVAVGTAHLSDTPRAGRWNVLGTAAVCGFSSIARARSLATAAEYVIDVDASGNVTGHSPAGPSAVVGKLARTMPGVAGAFRRARAKRRARARARAAAA